MAVVKNPPILSHYGVPYLLYLYLVSVAGSDVGDGPTGLFSDALFGGR